MNTISYFAVDFRTEHWSCENVDNGTVNVFQ